MTLPLLAHERTYGTIELVTDGDGTRHATWRITEIEPHVAIRLKQVFPRINKTAKPPYVLTGGPQLDADLRWFLSRYPLRIADAAAARMGERTTLFETGQRELGAILSPAWQPPAVAGFRGNQRPYAYQVQAAELARRTGRLLLMDEMGLGKSQPVSEPVLTPGGWREIGSLAVGDEVIGSNGKGCRVIGVFPQGDQPTYRVTLTDGSWTEASHDHLWAVKDDNALVKGWRWAVKSTEQLLRHGIRLKRGPAKFVLPFAEPAAFATLDLPLDPYVLGALIGDGNLAATSLTLSAPADKQEVVDRVRAALPGVTFGWHNAGTSSGALTFSGARGSPTHPLYAVRSLGLAVNSPGRFIPELYMRASIAQRLELLRGLMDTDGSCAANRVTYHTVSPQLAEDVASLVRSLAGEAIVRRYDRSSEGKPVEFQVNVRLDRFCPFHLTRKAAAWRPAGNRGSGRRIDSIVDVGRRPSVCISVDAEDRLYVTRNYIVTHNTVSAIAAVVEPDYLPALIVPKTDLPGQWAEQVAEFTHLRTHIVKRTKPYELPPADIVICPYSKLSGWIDYAETSGFRSVVFDEIQELRSGAGTAKGAAAQAFARQAQMVLGLSGTPIYNYGEEIWRICDFIEEGCLGDWWDFVREWCRPGPGGKLIVNDPQALGTFLRESHLALRRTRGDVGHERKFPSTIIHTVANDDEPLADEAALMASLARQVIAGSFTERGQAAREFDMRMRHATGLAKARHVAAFVKILLAAGQPVLLCGWHRDVYDIWLDELKDHRPLLYTGSESPAKKARTVRAFIEGETNLMIMSLRSGAGLDGLQQRCSTIVFGELDWSPKVHEQCVARLDRPGQERQVDAIYLVADDGSDPAIMGVLGLKSSQSAGIVDPLSAPSEQQADATRIRQLAELYLQGKSHLAAPAPRPPAQPDVPQPQQAQLI